MKNIEEVLQVLYHLKLAKGTHHFLLDVGKFHFKIWTFDENCSNKHIGVANKKIKPTNILDFYLYHILPDGSRQRNINSNLNIGFSLEEFCKVILYYQKVSKLIAFT